MTLKPLLKNNVPFAIVMHFEWIKFAPQSKNKIYELLILKNGMLKTRQLDASEVDEFKEINEQLKKVHQNQNGRVWEHLDFKSTLTKLNYKKSLVETY